jgi:hypothetical protein
LQWPSNLRFYSLRGCVFINIPGSRGVFEISFSGPYRIGLMVSAVTLTLWRCPN